jgi:hypothetical protein
LLDILEEPATEEQEEQFRNFMDQMELTEKVKQNSSVENLSPARNSVVEAASPIFIRDDGSRYS